SMGSLSIEIGFVPFFTGTDASGRRWRRIPRLTFPADGRATSVLAQDLRFHSKSAVWDAFAAGLQSGTAPTQFGGGTQTADLLGSGFGLTVGGARVAPSPAFHAGLVQTA